MKSICIDQTRQYGHRVERLFVSILMAAEYFKTKNPGPSEAMRCGRARVFAFVLRHFISRYRKVTIWPLVQVSSGLKVSAPVPWVTFFSTAQATALA